MYTYIGQIEKPECNKLRKSVHNPNAQNQILCGGPFKKVPHPKGKY
jgi:hypothetical protein